MQWLAKVSGGKPGHKNYPANWLLLFLQQLCWRYRDHALQGDHFRGSRSPIHDFHRPCQW
ncbi:protein of unknown function [Cyanobium sp. NIES-981]|nr:protein of unknown function [Cyanobium sp. NIES-981]